MLSSWTDAVEDDAITSSEEQKKVIVLRISDVGRKGIKLESIQTHYRLFLPTKYFTNFILFINLHIYFVKLKV